MVNLKLDSYLSGLKLCLSSGDLEIELYRPYHALLALILSLIIHLLCLAVTLILEKLRHHKAIKMHKTLRHPKAIKW